jgi:hypothetical protein
VFDATTGDQKMERGDFGEEQRPRANARWMVRARQRPPVESASPSVDEDGLDHERAASEARVGIAVRS